MVCARTGPVHMFLVQSGRTASLVQCRTRLRYLRAVASRALGRRGPVEKDSFPSDRSRQFVAFLAAHVAMRAFESKSRTRVVVEKRWFPLRAVVTLRTGCDSGFRKLQSMDVRVAGLAFRGRSLEIRVRQAGFGILRAMATAAQSGSVSTDEGERCLGVVEARELLPRFGGMAGLATERSSMLSPGRRSPFSCPRCGSAWQVVQARFCQ